MSKTIEAIPSAKVLINAIRSIGYSFSTAVADIIDNSISAEANKVIIESDPLDEEPFFYILDNGFGMNEEELKNAMLFGSNRDWKKENKEDLGKFGLGLKSASLSQCKNFIVASKKFGRINAMKFDLNVIESNNKWELQKLDNSEIDFLIGIDKLNEFKAGTIVIWNDFDKIEKTKFEESFRDLVKNSKKHSELVFHRFYEDIEIYYNGKRIEQRDPFLSSSKATQKGRNNQIKVENTFIEITPYTLPYANTLKSEEKKLLGLSDNKKSIYDDQGFYIYRNKRLIVWGSWLRMGIRSEFNKLARVKVDIPTELDDIWMLDVKKSSAKIPDSIKDALKYSVEDSIVRSRKVIRYPGEKEQKADFKIWNRIKQREGNVSYEINKENPLLNTILNKLDDEGEKLFSLLLKQLEEFIPKHSIHNDNADAINIVNGTEKEDKKEMMEQVVLILKNFKKDQREDMVNILVKMEQYKEIADYKQDILNQIKE